MINLTPVRFHTALDVYHYSIENRPLYDLNTNINILKEAFDNFSGNTQVRAVSGDWASTTLDLDLTGARGKQFMCKLTICASEDRTVLSNAAHIVTETWLVTGVVQLTGVVTILDTHRLSTRQVGTGGTLALAFSTVANGIKVSFPGFKGPSGKAVATVESFI